MPPKRLSLKLQASDESVNGTRTSENDPRVQESVQFTDNGTLKMLSRSRQEYKFTADGMSRTGSAPLSTERQLPLKVQPGWWCSCLQNKCKLNSRNHICLPESWQ